MIFGILIVCFIVFTMIRSLTIFRIILKSSTNIHNAITERVLRAKILFFDSNPIGRIVTRFSKDLVIFDLVVPILAMITI